MKFASFCLSHTHTHTHDSNALAHMYIVTLTLVMCTNPSTQNDFSFQFYRISNDVMVAADKQAMYQAVDTNGFTRESCYFSHHSAHHSNQQRAKNKKRHWQIHLDACFIVLPFWDFGITFQSGS